MTLGNQSAQNLSMAELYEGSAKAGVRFSQPREVVFPSGDPCCFAFAVSVLCAMIM